MDVYVPRSGIARTVGFLVDTGADSSLVMPKDADTLGVVSPADSQTTETFAGIGLGGISTEWQEPVVITLKHVDGTADRFDFMMPFAIDADQNDIFPSLVGMDLLQRYRLTVDLQADIVSLQ